MTPEEKVKELERRISMMEVEVLMRYADYEEELAKLRRSLAAEKMKGIKDEPAA